MKLFKRGIGSILLLLVMVTALTGCTYKGRVVYFETPSGHDTVFKIGNMKCDRDEAYIYLLNAKNIYGTVDDVNLWADGFNTSVMLDSVKAAVMQHLTRVYVLDLYAAEQEIELTEAEITCCDMAAKEYYSSLNSDEISFTGTSEKNISKMYQRYVLAQKVYKELMNSVDEEVSEDEARVMEAYVLFVSGNPQEMQEKIDAGYDFESIASSYTELDYYQETFARNKYPEAVDEVVFNLDTGAISPAIEADGGYYFFQCLDKYNEELSEENKKVIIEERRQKVLDDIVNELQDRYYSNMNTELWESMIIPSDMADKLVSGSFYEILDKNLK